VFSERDFRNGSQPFAGRSRADFQDGNATSETSPGSAGFNVEALKNGRHRLRLQLEIPNLRKEPSRDISDRLANFAIAGILIVTVAGDNQYANTKH
jgi:hypothetical protein